MESGAPECATCCLENRKKAGKEGKGEKKKKRRYCKQGVEFKQVFETDLNSGDTASLCSREDAAFMASPLLITRWDGFSFVEMAGWITCHSCGQ